MSETTEQITALSPDDKRAMLAALIREKHSKLKIAPVSFIQERFWFLEQLAPGSTHHIIHAAHIKGQIDATALKQSVSEVVRRHEILRTTIGTLGGQPMQIIAPPTPWPMPLVDLCHLSVLARKNETDRLLDAEATAHVDLAQGPLFRVSLLKLEEDEYILLLSLHHIICDGWSMGILFSELVTLYLAFSKGDASPLGNLSIQYADFARWQRERLVGEALDVQTAYWKQQLAGMPAELGLFTDHPRPPMQTFRAASVPLSLDKSLSQSLKALAQQQESTLFMALLAALNVLLYRYSGQEDICVGTVVANRVTLQLEELIGFFLNHLVLRTDVRGNPTFRELLGRVRETTLGAYAHQDLPFDKVLEVVRSERELSRAQLFQVFIVLQNLPASEIELPGLSVQPLGSEESYIDVDLSLSLSETSEGLEGDLGYNIDLFEASTIHSMVRHFKNLLAAAVAMPDEPIAALPLMTPQERDWLIDELNQTKADYPVGMTIQELFAAQVERNPNGIAVSFANEVLTYAQLNARSNQVAHYLCDLGVGLDMLVGIAMNRSLDMIIGLLGILKAGGAYLPLDPTYPPERLAFMLEDAHIRFLLTQEAAATDLPAYNGRVIVLDGAERTAIDQASVENPETLSSPSQLAYIIYTSGSTGHPKGVMIPQEALVQYVTAAISAFAITSSDRVLQFASLSFDTAAEEIYPCLLSGGQLVLRTPEMLDSMSVFTQTCAAEHVTVLDLPTAYWHLINSEFGESDLNWPDTLRLVILGGERALPEQVQAWQTSAPARIRLVNTYGPTETTIVATMCDLTGAHAPETASRAPIGRAASNRRVYALDSFLRPMPVGVPGELHIGGEGLAWGYLGQPELTAAKFIPDLYSKVEGARLYKTGDLVRYLPDGNLEFLGRVDRQVKIRGFRVELDEIQAVLCECPAVREAVVIAQESVPGNIRLAAYVVPKAGEPLEASVLQDYLKTKLPDYMVPSGSVILDSLPLTPSGKLDWRALAAYDTHSGQTVEFVAPQDALEENLAEVWRQVLRVERIGIYDNFFDLGGHSLLATQAVYRVNQALQIKLTVRDLFEEPTIAGLAMTIREILLDEIESAEEEEYPLEA